MIIGGRHVAGPAPTAPPPEAPESEGEAPQATETRCGVPGCGLPQRETDSGPVCAEGHGGAPPLVEPTAAQAELFKQVVNGERICRACWAERGYPLPGPEHQPEDGRCDVCGKQAALMASSLRLSALPMGVEMPLDEDHEALDF